MFSIYFDDPNMLVDPKDFRVIMGAAIEGVEKETILSVDKKFRYEEEIESCECLYARFPYKNNFSFLISSMNTYPQF